MNAVASKRSFWPHAIVGYFIIFTAFVAVFISWAVKQNMDLVRKDYYEEEVRFQQQMEKVQRTQPLQAAIQVAYETGSSTLNIRLPAAHGAQKASGRVHLYRPSNAGLDLDLPLLVSPDGQQKIKTAALQSGLWKVRLNWSSNGQEYFCERPILVD